jgi:hypothetical protein
VTDNNRLLLELERQIREINRETINPVFPHIGIGDISPVMRMVASSRAAYLKELFDIGEVSGEGMPSPEQISKLRQLRETYEEMVHATKALETAIQRGYLDVKTRGTDPSQ